MNRKSIKFLILLGLAVFSFSLIGCEKNHEKISKKLLKEKQEDRCLELIEALEEELDNDKNYKWDGNRFKLSVEGTLKETIDDIVAFHKENHAFLDKKGNFIDEKWNDWMYFYNNPEKIEDSEMQLVTSCFICIEKNSYIPIYEFESSLEQIDYKTLIKESEDFSELVQDKEDELTDQKILQLMYDSVKETFEGLSSKINIRIGRSGNKLYVQLKADVGEENITYICKKEGDRYSATLHSFDFTNAAGLYKQFIMDQSDLYGFAYNYGAFIGLLKNWKNAYQE